jgi:uncharacterized protein YndB with AHSA1/START domain
MTTATSDIEIAATPTGNQGNSSELSSDGRDLIIERIFDAPRELVFKAWTDPKHLARWWGPKYFTNPVCEFDARPGGKILIHMAGPDGTVYPMKGEVTNLVPPESLVMTFIAIENQQGTPILETTNTVTFAEHEGKTRLNLHVVVTKAAPEAAGALAGMEEGWNQSLDTLAEELTSLKGKTTMKTANRTIITAEPGTQELVITREFDAPRELVFRAFTDPEIYPQWLGPRGYTMTLDTFEPRNGGKWRYSHKDQQGNEYGFHGVYHDITAPERIICTFEFEGLPEQGHVTLDTARFEALPGGRTRLIAQSVFQSVADRDAMMQSGMETGVNDSYERLDELLANA